MKDKLRFIQFHLDFHTSTLISKVGEKFNVNLFKKVKAIKLVPEEINLEFSEQNNEIKFNVPKIYGHQMVELVY